MAASGSKTPDDGMLDLFSTAAQDFDGGDGTAGEFQPEGARVWSVSELNQVVRALLETQLPELWVGGEVTNWTRARSGHCYFTLKDEQAQLRCVMWRGDASRLPADPDEGMRVRAFGAPTLYEARGAYQLTVRQLEGDGREGLWHLAFERLRKRLEAEGLTDPARRRALPRFPQCVGVVTSPTGAAFDDILTVIRRRAPWTRVLLRGARVQGEGASEELAEAVRVLSTSGEVEVLIVGRGGGSIEDLWAFNEEPLARAIAESPVPVVSAVGHEVDVTIADLVADVRAPTPSAAAEATVQDGLHLRELLRTVRPRLARALKHQTEGRRHRLREGRLRCVRGVAEVIVPKQTRLDRSTERVNEAVRALVRSRRERLGATAARVDALSPLSTLRRGYAVPLDPEGSVLRRAAEFRDHRSFDLRVVDGRIRCETIEVKEEAVGE